MSEPVFKASNGTGALQTTDFSLALTEAQPHLNSTPTAISVDGNRYTLTISYNGVANGTETLTITPVANNIFDAMGNVASTAQSNNKLALNEVRIKPVTFLEYDNQQAPGPLCTTRRGYACPTLTIITMGASKHLTLLPMEQP